MLSNIDLQTLAQHYNLPLIGTPLRDNLPKGGPRPGYYVCNLDDSIPTNGQIGTHWTCLICTQMECLYVDSFGAPPPPEIAKWIKSKYDGFGWNNWILQDVQASTCGFWSTCIALQAFRYNKPGESMTECVNSWISGFGEAGNESKMKKWIRAQGPSQPLVMRTKLR